MKNLFRKYQKPLLKLANNRFGRRLLSIDTKEKIVGITDNAFAVEAENKLKAEFRCYPVYAKRIGFALVNWDESKQWLKGNKELYKGLDNYKGLFNYCGLLNSREFPTVMALEATKYSGAGNGGVTESTTDNWNNAHDSTSGDSTFKTGTVAIYCDSGGPITRMFFPIDLSSIGGGSKSSVATFTLTCVFNADNNNNPSWALVQGLQASTSTLGVDDFNDCGDAVDNPTEGTDARVLYSDLDAANETGTWTLNSTGRGWIDDAFGDWLKLGVRGSFDADDQEPGGNNRFYFGLSDQDGTTKDPTLVITYTPSSGFLVFM